MQQLSKHSVYGVIFQDGPTWKGHAGRSTDIVGKVGFLVEKPDFFRFTGDLCSLYRRIMNTEKLLIGNIFKSVSIFVFSRALENSKLENFRIF